MFILSQDGFWITRARSGNWGAALGSLLPLLSSAKEHSQTGPPGPRMWHVQSDTWTSQWCTLYHTSLLQRAAFLLGLPQLHHHEAKEEPVKRDDTLVAPIRGCPWLAQRVYRIDITTPYERSKQGYWGAIMLNSGGCLSQTCRSGPRTCREATHPSRAFLTTVTTGYEMGVPRP